MASSAIVIKVKFGETLRRFNASVHDKKLVLDIVMLREKIRALFSFDADVDFTMTYLDEDGDVVTLADDDDLHDAVRQSLNPLRITVNVNGKHGGSSGTSTPLKSPKQQQLSYRVSELLNHDHPLTKLLRQLESRGKSSNPAGLAEVIEGIKSVFLKQIKSGPIDNDTTGGPSNVDGGKGKSPTVDPEVGSLESVDLNLPYFEYEAFPPLVDEGANGIPSEKNKGTTDGVDKGEASGIEDISGSDKKKDASGGSSSGNLGDFGNTFDCLRQFVQDKVTGVGASSLAEFTKVNNDSGSSSSWARGMSECPFVGLPLPFETTVHGHRHSWRGPHWKRHGHGHGHGHGHVNGLGSVTFHRGVICDGCGVHPITGPRYKSKVKEDYDLCSVCYEGMGNVASDYIRMDRASSVLRHHMPFKMFHQPSVRIPPPTPPHAVRISQHATFDRAPGAKLPRVKLDSRFILDVNILDGTIMPPFTAFSKIWRMRNNGTVKWPCGSQLQWIGGDRLSSTLTADVEIPADGLPVDKEIDIAVDFAAPELPGRYISYWRMASPSGQKFGQRVWVLIQVDASMRDMGETSINLNLPNLNLPPVTRNPELVNQGPLMGSVIPDNIIKVTDSEGTSVNPHPKDQEKNFPINDSLIINNGDVSNTSTPHTLPVRSSVFSSEEVENALASLGPPVSGGANNPWAGPIPSVFFTPEESDHSSVGPVTYPTVDSTELPPAVVSAVPLTPQSTEGEKSDKEQALVRELEDMGFNQLDLNREILRMNNYDMQKSIDDLCGVSEWDPMLDELQEMGFADNETNRRLLKKNNGSLKRVVLDLINGEKA